MTNVPLDRAFNVAVLQIAARLFPTGYDVASEAPDTPEKIAEHYERTGRILVWNGASDHTIFADNEVNYAFRAWHDWRHYTTGGKFTVAGETQVYDAMCEDVRQLYGSGAIATRFFELLHAEILGQIEYRKIHSTFPVDQIGFTRAYLKNPREGVRGDFSKVGGI